MLQVILPELASKFQRQKGDIFTFGDSDPTAKHAVSFMDPDNRVKKKGGGVCMYVDEKMPYNMRNDLNEPNNLKDTGSLFLKLKSKNQKILSLV